MFIKTTLLAVAMILFAGAAQAVEIVQYQMGDNTPSVTVPEAAATNLNENFVDTGKGGDATKFNESTGKAGEVGESSDSGNPVYSFRDTGSSSTYTDFFLDFTLTPNTALNLESLTLYAANTANDGSTVDVLYDVNASGTYTSIGAQALTSVGGPNTQAVAKLTFVLSDQAALQGVTAPINFRVNPEGTAGSDSFFFVDDITVNGAFIPEPASLALMGLGGLLMLGRSGRKLAC